MTRDDAYLDARLHELRRKMELPDETETPVAADSYIMVALWVIVLTAIAAGVWYFI